MENLAVLGLFMGRQTWQDCRCGSRKYIDSASTHYTDMSLWSCDLAKETRCRFVVRFVLLRIAFISQESSPQRKQQFGKFFEDGFSFCKSDFFKVKLNVNQLALGEHMAGTGTEKVLKSVNPMGSRTSICQHPLFRVSLPEVLPLQFSSLASADAFFWGVFFVCLFVFLVLFCKTFKATNFLQCLCLWFNLERTISGYHSPSFSPKHLQLLAATRKQMNLLPLQPGTDSKRQDNIHCMCCALGEKHYLKLHLFCHIKFGLNFSNTVQLTCTPEPYAPIKRLRRLNLLFSTLVSPQRTLIIQDACNSIEQWSCFKSLIHFNGQHKHRSGAQPFCFSSFHLSSRD